MPDGHLLPARLDVYPSILEALQRAYDILPVVARLGFLNDLCQGREPLGEVIAVRVFEGKRDVAQCNVDGLGLEFGLVRLAVDEVFLLFGEVVREQNPGVEGLKQGGQLGVGGCKEDGESAYASVSCACAGG